MRRQYDASGWEGEWIDTPLGRMNIHDLALDISKPFTTGGDGDTIVAMQQHESGIMFAHFIKIDDDE